MYKGQRSDDLILIFFFNCTLLAFLSTAVLPCNMLHPTENHLYHPSPMPSPEFCSYIKIRGKVFLAFSKPSSLSGSIGVEEPIGIKMPGSLAVVFTLLSPSGGNYYSC